MRSSAENFLCSKNFLSIVFPPFMLMLHSFISFIHLLAIWKKRMDMDHIIQHIYRKTGEKKNMKIFCMMHQCFILLFHISNIFHKLNRKEVKNFLLYSFNWIFLFFYLLIPFFLFIYLRHLHMLKLFFKRKIMSAMHFRCFYNFYTLFNLRKIKLLIYFQIGFNLCRQLYLNVEQINIVT